MDLLKQFEALVGDNKLGLVRMRITEGYAPYEANGIYGFPPEEALRIYELGEAFPVDENGERIELEGPAPEPEKPVVHAVEIPADWKKKHYLQRIKLAVALSGQELTNSDKDKADEIIAAAAAERGIVSDEGTGAGEGGASVTPPADA